MAPKIDIISSCVVKSAAAPSISRLELTPSDLRHLQIFPIQRGLLFHKPQHHQTLIHHLKTSLSRALDFFPPLAGRLDASFSVVVCNNAGVEFTHAVAAPVAVSDIIEPKYIPEFVASSLFPLNDVANSEGTSKPLMAVQVTELVDGLFIGCSANHVVVDGASFWHFINSWSEISRGSLTISRPPVFDRSCFAGKSAAAAATPENQSFETPPPLPPLLKRIFHFSKESMAKLKSKANSEAGSDKISSFQALSALLWRTSTLSQLPKTMHNSPTDRKVNMLLIVNARSRIGISDYYFGNVVYATPTSATESELLQNGLGETALKINELVTRQISGGTAKKGLENPKKLRGDGRISSFFIVGSPRHDVYGNDFGWGKPIAMRTGKGRVDDGKFIIFPAAEDGSVDLEVCVTAERMAAMEDDADFMAALTV